DERVGDVLLHHLLLREDLALRAARERAFAHHRERALHHRDGAHRMVDAPAAEPRLRDRERLALAAEQVLGGGAHAPVADGGVAGRVSGWPWRPSRFSAGTGTPW